MKVLSDIVFVKDKSKGDQKNSSSKDGEQLTLDDEAKNNLRQLIEEARRKGEMDI
jgi:hypothetical protein